MDKQVEALARWLAQTVADTCTAEEYPGGHHVISYIGLATALLEKLEPIQEALREVYKSLPKPDPAPDMLHLLDNDCKIATLKPIKDALTTLSTLLGEEL